MALALISLLLGWMKVTRPRNGSKVTCLAGALLPPVFTHRNLAVPPEEVKKASVTISGSPRASNIVVRLLFAFFSILGSGSKYGLAPRTGVTTTDAARVTANRRIVITRNFFLEPILGI